MQLRLFLIRGLVAIVWAVVFAMASDSLTTGVGVLLGGGVEFAIQAWLLATRREALAVAT